MKRRIIVIAALLVVSMVIVVFAEPIEKEILVVYNDIKVIADGKQVDLKDAGGNVLEPFIYNGTVYFPMEAVGAMFDKPVSWDPASRSVYIGRNPTTTMPTVWLKDMDYLTQTRNSIRPWPDDRKDNVGNAYFNGGLLFGGGDDTSRIYLLNGKYSLFTGVVVLPENDKDTNRTTTVRIIGDGVVLFNCDVLRGSLPQDFHVDVSGVLKLELAFYMNKSGYGRSIGIVDAGFIP